MSHSNPYSKAAEAYGTTAATTDQHALEGQLLLKAAKHLEDLATLLGTGEKVSREDIGDVLDYNQVFVEDAMNVEHTLPQDIKNNIAELGLYVFKRTNEILLETTPEKFKVLVNINRNIAAGLMKQQAAPASTSKSKTQTDAADSFV